ncbi:MAG: hypothetical protein KAS94_01450 [Desulfobulbaceae bacterium]|nr:hypothetical protein [Desulfobulbaceae bacterium]
MGQKASGCLQGETESFDDRVLGSGAFVEALRQDENLKAMLPQKLSLLESQKVVGKLFEVGPVSILQRTRMN